MRRGLCEVVHDWLVWDAYAVALVIHAATEAALRAAGFGFDTDGSPS